MRPYVFVVFASLVLGVSNYLTSNMRDPVFAQYSMGQNTNIRTDVGKDEAGEGAIPIPVASDCLRWHVVSSSNTEGNGTILTVVVPELQRIAVFEISNDGKKVIPRSVRYIHWELQLKDYNAEYPLPQEIEAFLKKGPQPGGFPGARD